MNPYDGVSFWEFFVVLFSRIAKLFTGHLEFGNLASDEIQILVLAGVAISSAMVGTFLVLKQMTMLANSLSHTILLGIVLAYFFTKNSELHNEHSLSIFVLIISAFAMGILTTYLTELLTKIGMVQEDASIGVVFTSLFAAGIILATLLTRSAHIGLEAVMGNADALHIDDCKLTYAVLAMNALIFFLFFKEFVLTTFDPNLSVSLGYSTTFFNYLLMTQVSATAISAFRAVGVLMVLAFITGPVLSARLYTHSLKKMFLLSVTIGCGCAIVGVALSRHLLSSYGFAFSTGGIVVCTIIAFFLLSVFQNKFLLKASVA